MASPLHEAIRFGAASQVRSLLAAATSEERSQQLAALDRRGLTPFAGALAACKVDVAIALLEYSSTKEVSTELFTTNPYGRTILHVAAEWGNEAAIPEILALAPCIEIRSRLLSSTTTHGACTALHLAATKGHAGAARALLEHGTAEDRRWMLAAQEHQGLTPFLVAVPWIEGDEGYRTALTLLEFCAPEDWASMLLSTDRSGKTLLHHAARKGQEAEVEALLARAGGPAARGALLAAASAEGWTPLHLAANHGHAGAARVLLAQAGSEDRHRMLRAEDLKGCTAFGLCLKVHSLCVSGGSACLAVAMVLLEYATVEEGSLMLAMKAPNGKTLLHLLAAAGEEENVRALLLATSGEDERAQVVAAGSSVKAWTPLHSAACWGRAGVVRALMELAPTEAARAAMLAPSGTRGLTPLHLALGETADRCGDTFCTLLTVSTDHEIQRLFTARDDSGSTALMLAAQRQGRCGDGSQPCPKILDWSDSWGKTLLHRAAESGDVANIRAALDLASMCRSRLRCVLHRDSSGWTPLHRAACFGREKACEALLECARDSEERNHMLEQSTSEGWTAWHFARAASVELRECQCS